MPWTLVWRYVLYFYSWSEAAEADGLQACAICVENEGAMDSMPSLNEASDRKKQ